MANKNKEHREEVTNKDLANLIDGLAVSTVKGFEEAKKERGEIKEEMNGMKNEMKVIKEDIEELTLETREVNKRVEKLEEAV